MKNIVKKFFVVFSVVALLVLSTVAVSAKSYKSPTATTQKPTTTTQKPTTTTQKPTATTSPEGVDDVTGRRDFGPDVEYRDGIYGWGYYGKDGTFYGANGEYWPYGYNPNSPLTGDMTVYAILAVAGFGGITALAFRKIRAKK